MRSYYADEAGRLTRVNTWGRGWGALDNLSSGRGLERRRRSRPHRPRDRDRGPAALRGDRAARLLRRRRPRSGRGSWGPTSCASSVTSTATASADAVARTVERRPHRPARPRRRPLRAACRRGSARGWQIFDLIEPVGDYSNDGVPDLLARTTGGDLRLYAMTRSLTFGWSIAVGTGWQGARSITGDRAVNADVNADVVVLRTDGSVRLYRGTGPGALNYYDVVLTGADRPRDGSSASATSPGTARTDILAQSGRWPTCGSTPGTARAGFRSTREPVLCAVARWAVFSAERPGRRGVRVVPRRAPRGCLPGLAVAPTAQADEVYPRPAGTSIEFLGHGWGHGNGMSQYGSLGGAQAGASWQQILAKLLHRDDARHHRVADDPGAGRLARHHGAGLPGDRACGSRGTSRTSSELPTSRNGVADRPLAARPGPEGRRDEDEVPSPVPAVRVVDVGGLRDGHASRARVRSSTRRAAR